jgi:hypothetical protein
MGLIEGCVAAHGDYDCDCVTRTVGPLTGGYELREVTAPSGDDELPNGVGWIVHYPDRTPAMMAFIAPKLTPYKQVEGRGSTRESWEVYQLVDWHYVVTLHYRGIHERVECWSFRMACDQARYFIEKARRRYPVKSDPLPEGVAPPEPKPKRPRKPRAARTTTDPLIRAMG